MSENKRKRFYHTQKNFKAKRTKRQIESKRDFKTIISKIILGKTLEICRICLGDTQKGFVHLHDSVAIENGATTETKSLREILTLLGGGEFADDQHEEEFPVCMNCTKTAISSYLFTKMCRESSDTLHDMLESAYNSIPTSFKSNTKTMYLILDKKPLILVDKTVKATNPFEARKRVKLLLDHRRYYAKTKVKKQFFCGQCKEYFKSKCQLDRHIKFHTQDYKCNDCDKIFTHRWKLTSHIKRIHSILNFQCSECLKMFSTEAIMNAHIKDRHQPVYCTLCGITLKNKCDFRYHQSTHEEKICPQCGRSYKDPKSFQHHTEHCDGIKIEKPLRLKKKVFSCHECGKGYFRKEALQVHIKFNHGNGKSIICQWCGKRFTAVSVLKSHELKHTGVKNFDCPTCNKKFVSNAALTYHIRLHTGERPYPCPIEGCEERFLNSSRRMRHIKRVHAPPSYKCSMCSSAFCAAYDLKKHVQSKHSRVRLLPTKS